MMQNVDIHRYIGRIELRYRQYYPRWWSLIKKDKARTKDFRDGYVHILQTMTLESITGVMKWLISDEMLEINDDKLKFVQFPPSPLEFKYIARYLYKEEQKRKKRAHTLRVVTDDYKPVAVSGQNIQNEQDQIARENAITAMKDMLARKLV
jgi:hypothetical protein